MENVVEVVADLPRLAEVAVILHLPTDWIVTVPLEPLTLQPPLAAYLTGLPSLPLAEALNDGSPHRLSPIFFKVMPAGRGVGLVSGVGEGEALALGVFEAPVGLGLELELVGLAGPGQGRGDQQGRQAHAPGASHHRDPPCFPCGQLCPCALGSASGLWPAPVIGASWLGPI